MFGNFKRSAIIRNIAKLGSFSVVSQLITSLSMLFITRLYGPEGVGIQGAFLAALSILVPFAALRYPQAIVVAADDLEARIVERLSIFVAIIVFILLTIGILFQSDNSARLLGLGEQNWLVFALPLAVLFSGYQETMTQRVVRMERFGAMGKTGVSQALFASGGRIGSGLIYPHPGNLIAVSVLNPLFRGLLLHRFSAKHVDSHVPKRVSKKSLLLVMQKYRDFPLYRVPTDMVYAISEAIPVFFLTYFFGATEAGYYALSRSLLIIPNKIIGQSVSSVTYARMANLNREKRRFSRLLRKSSLLLLLGPGLLVVFLVFAVQPYFSFLFGNGWDAAGPFALWISIWMACNLGNAPATRVANILNRQREVLYFNIIFLIIQVGVPVGLAGAGYGALAVVAGYSLISALREISLSVLLQYFTKIHESRW